MVGVREGVLAVCVYKGKPLNLYYHVLITANSYYHVLINVHLYHVLIKAKFYYHVFVARDQCQFNAWALESATQGS